MRSKRFCALALWMAAALAACDDLDAPAGTPPPSAPSAESPMPVAPTAARADRAQPSPAAPAREPAPFSDPERRAEIHATLARIAAGGPYPYRQDGTVFENREGRLPVRVYAYYHEYTVRTPGVPTRGARRIVRGAAAETYYTDDHYRSFVVIDPSRY